jgi:hypothetical protein
LLHVSELDRVGGRCILNGEVIALTDDVVIGIIARKTIEPLSDSGSPGWDIVRG